MVLNAAFAAGVPAAVVDAAGCCAVPFRVRVRLRMRRWKRLEDETRGRRVVHTTHESDRARNLVIVRLAQVRTQRCEYNKLSRVHAADAVVRWSEPC